jgi:hypothetical protein
VKVNEGEEGRRRPQYSPRIWGRYEIRLEEEAIPIGTEKTETTVSSRCWFACGFSWLRFCDSDGDSMYEVERRRKTMLEGTKGRLGTRIMRNGISTGI